MSQQNGREYFAFFIRVFLALAVSALGLLGFAEEAGQHYVSRAYHYSMSAPTRWHISGGGKGLLALTDFPPNRILAGGVRPSGGAEILVGPVAAWGTTKADGVNDIEKWIRQSTRLSRSVSRFEIPAPKADGWATAPCIEVTATNAVGPGIADDRVISDYCMFRGEPFRVVLLCWSDDRRQSELVGVLHSVLASIRESP